MNTILKVEHLSKKYEHFCLRDISFSLPSGCIMGLIGENGAGKTTTLKLILNLIRRDGGSVEIFGKDGIQEEKSVKEQIGVVLDEGGFHEMLTPRDIGNIMKGVYLKSWDGALYQRYLERFSLPGRKQIKEFSRGMKVKLSIAAALSHHPRFLLLDEATSGLDPVMRDEILDIFQEFITEENHAVLLSSHITSDLEKIADYITLSTKGSFCSARPRTICSTITAC